MIMARTSGRREARNTAVAAIEKLKPITPVQMNPGVFDM